MYIFSAKILLFKKIPRAFLVTLRGVAGPHLYHITCGKATPIYLAIFFKIPFASSILGSKKIYFSDMLGYPEGRGRATPICIFWEKINVA